MWRFIVVTFGFLGWAFFELSGGADYAPRDGSLQAARAEIRVQTERQARRAQIAREAAQAVDVSSATTGAGPAGNDDTAQLVLAATARPDAPPADKRQRLTLSSRPDSTGRGVSTPALNGDKRNALTRSGTATGIPADLSPEEQAALAIEIVTSRLREAEPARTDRTETAQAPRLAVSQDIRVVNGVRVNLRGGPGTHFGVVDSLTLGTRVEVLNDPGTGWVELRVYGHDVSGWMAEWLLVAAN